MKITKSPKLLAIDITTAWVLPGPKGLYLKQLARCLLKEVENPTKVDEIVAEALMMAKKIN